MGATPIRAAATPERCLTRAKCGRGKEQEPETVGPGGDRTRTKTGAEGRNAMVKFK